MKRALQKRQKKELTPTKDKIMPTDKLLPCPFCDGRASQHDNEVGDKHYFFISCRGCNTISKYYHGKQESIKAWNTRATTKREAELQADVKHLKRDLATWKEFCKEGNAECRLISRENERLQAELSTNLDCVADGNGKISFSTIQPKKED